jgi:hypothetical protein
MPQVYPFHYPPETDQFFVRPITPADRDVMARGFAELSVQSRYMRFFQSLARLSDYQLDHLTRPDGTTHVAWGILDATGKDDRGIGVMRFIRLKDDPTVAETAITIIDRYQRMGLSYVAFCVLNILAHRAGVQRFRHHVLHGNHFVLETLEVLGILSSTMEGGVHIIETAVIAGHLAVPDRPQLQRLRFVMEQVEELMLSPEVE